MRLLAPPKYIATEAFAEAPGAPPKSGTLPFAGFPLFFHD